VSSISISSKCAAERRLEPGEYMITTLWTTLSVFYENAKNTASKYSWTLTRMSYVITFSNHLNLPIYLVNSGHGSPEVLALHSGHSLLVALTQGISPLPNPPSYTANILAPNHPTPLHYPP